jgi:hypothetical protein
MQQAVHGLDSLRLRVVEVGVGVAHWQISTQVQQALWPLHQGEDGPEERGEPAVVVSAKKKKISFESDKKKLGNTEEKSPTLSEGPPFRSNLPLVIGRTTPGFFLGNGEDKLVPGSPEGTDTV